MGPMAKIGKTCKMHICQLSFMVKYWHFVHMENQCDILKQINCALVSNRLWWISLHFCDLFIKLICN